MLASADVANATKCQFRINDSPIWDGLFVVMRPNGFARVLVDEAVMMSIGAFIAADGDIWEPEEPRSDGLYDLWDYAITLVDGRAASR